MSHLSFHSFNECLRKPSVIVSLAIVLALGFVATEQWIGFGFEGSARVYGVEPVSEAAHRAAGDYGAMPLPRRSTTREESSPTHATHSAPATRSERSASSSSYVPWYKQPWWTNRK